MELHVPECTQEASARELKARADTASNSCQLAAGHPFLYFPFQKWTDAPLPFVFTSELGTAFRLRARRPSEVHISEFPGI